MSGKRDGAVSLSYTTLRRRPDDTNGTSLRRDPLLLNDLQLLSDDKFKIYVDMCHSLLGYETSEFRIIETVFIKVNIASGHSEIRRKAMRHRDFRLS